MRGGAEGSRRPARDGHRDSTDRDGTQMKLTLGILLVLAAPILHAQNGVAPFDAAPAFGARQSVTDLSLSPDGKRVAYIAPAAGQGAVLYTLSLERDSPAQVVTMVDGNPNRLASCSWVADDRLACVIYGVTKNPQLGLLRWTRTIAVNADGTNFKLLSTQQNEHSRGWHLGGGEILDYLPDENGSVLMTRVYLPDEHLGSRLGSTKQGLGVDRVDTRTLAASQVEHPDRNAVEYISDGHGTV